MTATKNFGIGSSREESREEKGKGGQGRRAEGRAGQGMGGQGRRDVTRQRERGDERMIRENERGDFSRHHWFIRTLIAISDRPLAEGTAG